MIFYQQRFLLSSVILNGLLYEQNISHLAGNCLRNFSLIDPQSNYLPQKFPNPWHSEIFLYNWLLTTLICVLLAETVNYICFGQKSSYLHIGVSVLIWHILHLLDIHLLLFDDVHLVRIYCKLITDWIKINPGTNIIFLPHT